VIWAGLIALGLAAAPARQPPPRPPPAAPAPAPAPSKWSNPELVKAEKLLDDLDYEGAALALLTAHKTPRNDRKTILRILELQGVIAASLDQKASALNFFRQLLVLDPDFQLSESSYSAEQRAPFNQARASLASTGSLRFEVAPARAKPGLVETVVVKVADPLSLARKVRLWLRPGDGPWKESVVPVTEGRASAPAGVATVSFWAELLGEHEGQLAVIGSREKPIVLRAPTAADSAVSSGPGLDLGGYRPFSLAAGGAAVVATAVGAYFGARAAQIGPQIEAWRAEGVVHSVTQAQAQRMVEEANGSAVIADVLFAAGGVLGGAGVALWFIEPEKSPAAGPGAGQPRAPAGLRVDIRWRF